MKTNERLIRATRGVIAATRRGPRPKVKGKSKTIPYWVCEKFRKEEDTEPCGAHNSMNDKRCVTCGKKRPKRKKK